jgi:Uma2 family endonuclease
MSVDVTRPRRLFTVDEYHQMADAGIFGPEERVELIDGDIIEMSPIGPRHAGCAIEVADTTARFDRIVKARLYGRACIGEYWLVDVGTGRVDVFRMPTGDAYAETIEVGRGGTMAPLAFPDVVIAVDDLLA